jgi:hypothetical protein
LAIDPLQRIIEIAAQKGILRPILPKAANLRCSLYTDDAAIFADPSALELGHLYTLLNFFGDYLGLKQHLQNRSFPHPGGQ